MYPCGRVQSAAWYGASWHPYGHFYNPYAWPVAPWPPVAYYPVYYQPSPMPSAPASMPMIFPQEMVVESTGEDEVEGNAWVGGGADAYLTLEYAAAEEATNPRIAVTTTPGGTAVWEEAGFDATYHVKSDLPAVSPGTQVRVTVSQARARLRWCELLKCGQKKEGT